MRISTAQFFQTGLKSINAQQSDLMHLFQQIGSGQRMVTPADDPLAAAQSINISQSQSLALRYAENRAVAKRNLGTEEQVLESVTLQLQEVKTQLVQVGNGTLSDADRSTLAKDITHLRATLLGLANATDGNGQYLFSGSLGDTQPFNEVTGAYQGDGAQRDIQVDQTRRLAGADVGLDVFVKATVGGARYLTYAGSKFGEASQNTGSGIISKPSVQDATLGLDSYQYEIRFVSSSQFEVSVYDLAAADPGLALAPADFPGLTDWTGLQTLAPGQTNSLALPFGINVQLSGEPAPGDVFGVAHAAGQDVNLFETLDILADMLTDSLGNDAVSQAGFRNMLSSSMQRIDVNYDAVLTVRASVGARLNEIDALDINGDVQRLGYLSHLSKLEDLDYYSAATQLELRKTALEAAALAFRKIQANSLFTMGGNG